MIRLGQDQGLISSQPNPLLRQIIGFSSRPAACPRMAQSKTRFYPSSLSNVIAVVPYTLLSFCYSPIPGLFLECALLPTCLPVYLYLLVYLAFRFLYFQPRAFISITWYLLYFLLCPNTMSYIPSPSFQTIICPALVHNYHSESSSYTTCLLCFLPYMYYFSFQRLLLITILKTHIRHLHLLSPQIGRLPVSSPMIVIAMCDGRFH